MADQKISELTEDTSPDGAADFLPTVDTSASGNKKVKPNTILGLVNGLTEDTAPSGSADFLLSYDTSATAPKKVKPDTVLGLVNGLTEDASPDGANDFVLSYDASATAPKKVKIANIGTSAGSVPTSRTITAGSGLTGGGDLSANRTLALDINGLTEDTSPDASADFIATYDASATANKKVSLAVARNSPVKTESSSYTLVLADAGKWIRMDNASANNLTVPPNSSVAFPVGTEIHVEQKGAGQTTIVAGSGVTINTSETLKLAARYAVATIKKVASDEWTLIGYLEAA